MNIAVDMHTHTVASGHAYSTVNELAAAAASKGLRGIALTDHGPALPGGPHPYHFAAIRFIPPSINGVRIILGVEANILDLSGDLDLPPQQLERLDFVMAGLHEGCGYDGRGIDDHTEAVMRAMENPRVKAISHPGNPAFPLRYEKIVAQALRTGTAIEINNSSFTVSRVGSRTNCDIIARLIAESGAPVIVGSDAHIAQGVGEFGEAVAALERAGVKEEQVVNTTLERVSAFLGLK